MLLRSKVIGEEVYAIIYVWVFGILEKNCDILMPYLNFTQYICDRLGDNCGILGKVIQFSLCDRYIPTLQYISLVFKGL
ncbi:MAG: hypothetical protein DSM106950_34875 [Stigonema ocellatum SAG 48.90 = DSM 106950]|nr:hypothetical protein [Stigonema ocellatum SAG 48.90 = DSM 106950]